MSDTLLRVEDLKIYYPVAGSGFGKKEFVKAVDGVTFEVKKGEVFGIVGGPCVSGWRRYYRVQ